MKLMLDSGAYSAWTKGKQIDVVEYTKFALDNEELFDYIITLDVIPGIPGKIPTTEEKAVSATRGWQNFKYMLKSGVPREKLIHVYHQGEDTKWLERMMRECSYVGIAPSKDRVTKQKRIFLYEKVKDVIADKEGRLLVKTHGFGVTSENLLDNFPWTSADSSSWVSYGRYGCILVPQFDPLKAPFKVTVTKGTNYVGMKDMFGFDVQFSRTFSKRRENIHNKETFKPTLRKTVMDYLEKCDFTLEAVSEDHLSRDKINMLYYMRLKDMFGIDIWFSGNFALLADVKREVEFQEFFKKKGYEYKRLVSYGFKDEIKDILEMRKEEIRGSEKRGADGRSGSCTPRAREEGRSERNDALRLHRRGRDNVQRGYANKLPV